MEEISSIYIAATTAAIVTNELDNIILMDYISRPKIHSLIITNVERNLLLKDNIKEAKRNR
jgi:hypothetical protein